MKKIFLFSALALASGVAFAQQSTVLLPNNDFATVYYEVAPDVGGLSAVNPQVGYSSVYSSRYVDMGALSAVDAHVIMKPMATRAPNNFIPPSIILDGRGGFGYSFDGETVIDKYSHPMVGIMRFNPQMVRNAISSLGVASSRSMTLAERYPKITSLIGHAIAGSALLGDYFWRNGALYKPISNDPTDPNNLVDPNEYLAGDDPTYDFWLLNGRRYNSPHAACANYAFANWGIGTWRYSGAEILEGGAVRAWCYNYDYGERQDNNGRRLSGASLVRGTGGINGCPNGYTSTDSGCLKDDQPPRPDHDVLIVTAEELDAMFPAEANVEDYATEEELTEEIIPALIETGALGVGEVEFSEPEYIIEGDTSSEIRTDYTTGDVYEDQYKDIWKIEYDKDTNKLTGKTERKKETFKVDPVTGDKTKIEDSVSESTGKPTELPDTSHGTGGGATGDNDHSSSSGNSNNSGGTALPSGSGSGSGGGLCGYGNYPDCSVDVNDDYFKDLDPYPDGQLNADEYGSMLASSYDDFFSENSDFLGINFDWLLPDLGSSRSTLFATTCDPFGISIFGHSVSIDYCFISSFLSPILMYFMYLYTLVRSLHLIRRFFGA